jgi:hypothetical protein
MAMPLQHLDAAAFAGIDPGTGKPVCANGGTARLAIDIAWETSDYTNWGSGVTPAAWGQPFSLNPLAVAGCATAVPAAAISGPDATGAFTLTSPNALADAARRACPPASATMCPAISNIAVVIEGHPGVVTTGPGATAIPVTSVVSYANVAGATPVARRMVVDIAKCDVCHSDLAHGDNRNDNTASCVACHNPASTDVGMRQTLTAPGIDGLWEQTIDFKHMIHAIHDGSVRGAAGSPFVIYGYGGSVNNFTDVVYPGQLNRCDACHVGTSYYPVDDTAVQATTFLTGLSKESPNPTTVGNPISTSANMAVCSACHVDATRRNAHAAKRRLDHGHERRGRPHHPSTNPANVGNLRILSWCRRSRGCEGRAQHSHHGELSARFPCCAWSPHSHCCWAGVMHPAAVHRLRIQTMGHRIPIRRTVPRERIPASAAIAMPRSPEYFRTKHASPDDPHGPFGHGGLQCEACHGPGGAHVRRKAARSPACSTFGPKR